MRVAYLYDLDLPAPMAAPIQILQTARAMADQGASVFTGWGRVRADALPFYGLEPHERLAVRRFFTPISRLSLRHGLERIAAGADVIISRGETGVRIFEALARVKPRPRFVFEIHRPTMAAPGWLSGMSQEKAEALEARAVRESDGVICISRGLLEALRQRHGELAPAIVLPSGTAPAEPAPAGPRDLDVVYVGKLGKRKGIDLMLQTMTHLPGTRLTLIGGKPETQTAAQEAAGRLGIAQAVEFAGYIPPSRVRSYLLRARVGLCALPEGEAEVSERFTSPMKVLEMMACGTPIVATDLPSVREILVHERNALLAPPGDPAAVASAVRRLMEDWALAARLAAQARRDVEAYTWPSRGRNLLEFLSGVVSADRD